MSRALRTVLWMALIGLVLALLATGALVTWAGDPLAHAVVSIDGREVTLAQLHADPALFAIAAFVVLLVLALVVPFALLLVPLALAWWLIRRRKAAPASAR